MSGIGGIFNRDKMPVAPEQLESIGTTLAHRGPDGISYFRSNQIGLLHCMLHDTPESLFERLPNSTPDKRYHITWHGRIDNREELRHITGWDNPLSYTSDSDLILAAYKKWGKDCVLHLLGDFAFAIWDTSAQKLFCARDHMGIKPFYYLLTNKFFAFASEIKGLLALPECSDILNKERIADFLTCGATDTQSTFYDNILRLCPGHFLEITADRNICYRYWEPHPTQISYRNSAAYEEQFYEIFANAVRCRLRSSFSVGSLLSGGLDSSSIVCMAAGRQQHYLPGPLHTFSGVFDKINSCDERSYFQSVLDRYKVIPHSLYADQIDPGNSYDQVMKTEDEPFLAPHFFMIWELMVLARKAGVRILLDGHDGDSAVSHGSGLLPELLIHGKWLRLAKECHAMGSSPSVKNAMRFFLRVCKDTILNAISPISPVLFQQRHFSRTLMNLDPIFLAQTNIRERLLLAEANRPKPGQTEFLRHKRTITQPMHSITLEFLERQGMQHNLVGRYPFFAKQLIEFCLALPSKQKFNAGYTRNIVRKSLNTILPESINTRKTKTNFAPNLRHAFSVSGKSWLSFKVDNIHENTYNYVDKNKFFQSYHMFLDNPSKVDLHDLGLMLRVVVFAQWLKNK